MGPDRPGWVRGWDAHRELSPRRELKRYAYPKWDEAITSGIRGPYSVVDYGHC
jgi:hypothetical protein